MAVLALLQLSKIRRYGPRLEAFHFKRVFDEKATDVAKVRARGARLQNVAPRVLTHEPPPARLAPLCRRQATDAIKAATNDILSSKRLRKLLEVWPADDGARGCGLASSDSGAGGRCRGRCGSIVDARRRQLPQLGFPWRRLWLQD